MKKGQHNIHDKDYFQCSNQFVNLFNLNDLSGITRKTGKRLKRNAKRSKNK